MSTFLFDGVRSFGRSLDEYQAMFSFAPPQWRGKTILDCPSGCNSFASSASANDFRVVAVDPLYRLPLKDLREQALEDIRHIVDRSFAAPELLVPERMGTPEQVLEFREAILEAFFADFLRGTTGTYLSAQLPHLPFRTGTFDLVLSGHFLFCYQEEFSEEFHVHALEELLRVTTGEVRIYPVRSLNTEVSRHLEPCRQTLARRGFHSEIRPTAYELVRNWNEMLVLFSRPGGES